MFNDDESRARTDALHAELLRQRAANERAARAAADAKPQPSPAAIRAQMAKAGYRPGGERRG